MVIYMYVVFSDLDGTLLHSSSYAYNAAIPAIKLIQQQNIPLVVCTSKTRSEVEIFRQEIGNHDPFIIENGAAIYIPKNIIKSSLLSHFTNNVPTIIENDKYIVVIFGTSYAKLLKALNEIRSKGFKIIGFNDMSADEVSKETGLSVKNSQLAKDREFDEAFKLISGDPNNLEKAIAKKGLNCSKAGRYWHIMGNNDKGKSVRILIDFYKKMYARNIISIGLGDSENDFPMLDSVDKPILIKRPNRSYPSKKYFHQDIPAPEGWRVTIENILKK